MGDRWRRLGCEIHLKIIYFIYVFINPHEERETQSQEKHKDE